MKKEIRQAFNCGDEVIVDGQGFNGIKVISQTPKKLYTSVQAPDGYRWTIMTYRLKLKENK